MSKVFIFRGGVFLLLQVMFLSLFFDPTDQILGLKKISFLLVLLIMSIHFLFVRKELICPKNILVFTLFVIISLIGLFFSVINYNNITNYDESITVGYSLSFLFVTIILFTSDVIFENLMNRAVLISGLSLAFCTIFTWFMYSFFQNNSLFNELVIFLNYKSNSAMITTREFGSFKLSMIYFKSVVLLFAVIPICIDRYKSSKTKILFLIGACFFSLILSGTRTNIILSFFLFSFLLYGIASPKLKKYIFFVFFVTAPFLVFKLTELVLKNADISFDIKANDFQGYLDLFLGNLNYLFIGDGFGALMYAHGKGIYVPLTELVYFDLIRWFGFFIFSMIVVLMLYPSFVFYKYKSYHYFGSYACYLIVMGTNPLFISSTGMLAMVIFFSKANNIFRLKGNVDFLR